MLTLYERISSIETLTFSWGQISSQRELNFMVSLKYFHGVKYFQSVKYFHGDY